MFEAAEVGRSVSKEQFASQAEKLQVELLAAQQELARAGFPVIILVSGVEGAGKGSVVNRLHRWLDTRQIVTATFWDETDEERERPRFWRFWRALPPRGRIGILFGSWYTMPIIARVQERMEKAEFDRELHNITEFERLLTDDGAVIVKLWFHISRETQQERLKADRKSGRNTLSPMTKAFSKLYKRFWQTSERALRITDQGHAPWHVIEATDDRYRDLTAGQIVLKAIRDGLARTKPAVTSVPIPAPPDAGDQPTVLSNVDLSQSLSPDEYKTRIADLQLRLSQWSWKLREQRRHCVAVFEGWDAAGKGGAIRRVTETLDARLYRAISIAAPTDEEAAQHYLWRFWRHIPRAGHMTIYDRSWYGRVLVERVESFARREEWGRAYQEINDFEEQLADHGTILLKFWLHIDHEEQERRFTERQATPAKQYKITEEDWRNRSRRRDYELAVDEMVARCSTTKAPWTIVPANDKRLARVRVLSTFCERLERALDR